MDHFAKPAVVLPLAPPMVTPTQPAMVLPRRPVVLPPPRPAAVPPAMPGTSLPALRARPPPGYAPGMPDTDADQPQLLLTPGPLTTSARTRAALGRDWGSRDAAFIALSESVRARLAGLVGGAGSHVAVPIQGAGTFAVEAAVQSLVPRDGKLLVLVNGAYGRRIAEMARRVGRLGRVLEVAEDQPVPPDAVRAALADDAAITDVALVHCETTSGILNPLAPIAEIVQAGGRRLILDAMSSFGAVPIDLRATPCAAVVGSANKGLEGVPGLGFVVAELAHLGTCADNAVSLSLDLHAQWRGFETNQQWRFTPPVQVVAGIGRSAGPAGGGRRRPRQARPLPGQLRDADRRPARARLCHLHRRRPPGAGDRDVPHPARRLVRLRPLLQFPGRARGGDLPGQADSGTQLPHRLHRRCRTRGDGACALAAVEAFMVAR